MNSNEDPIRAAIADQAGEWFVASDEGPLDARDSAALAAWFKTSPIHIEEFLGVSAIARDLKEAGTDPEYSVEAILARARAEDGPAVQPLRPRPIEAARDSPRGWMPAAAAMAACAVLSLGLLWMGKLRPLAQPPAAERITALHFETGHGEQLTHRLADNSVLHLNTDSAVTVRYSKSERLVTLTSGQAGFEVAHESHRAFRVDAGAAEVLDLGTQFDVRLEQGSAVVTVVEGRVAVGPSPLWERPGSNLNRSRAPQFVQLSAGQQIRMNEDGQPAAPETVDAQRTTAWLRRQIVFDHEPLERVAAEYNRYSAKPIEIATPALRNLQISGVFATDDTDAFIAFLRSLQGVQVEVTATRIRVSRD